MLILLTSPLDKAATLVRLDGESGVYFYVLDPPNK